MLKKSFHKRYLKIAGKVILSIAGFLLGVFLLVLIVFNSNYIQEKISNRLTDVLSLKTGTVVRVARVRLTLTGNVSLKGIYIEDLKQDTLLSVSSLTLNTNYLALLDHSVEFSKIQITKATAYMVRGKNGRNYNYQFIIDSLSNPKKRNKSKKSWDLSVNQLSLEKIHYVLDDRLKNLTADFTIGGLDLDIDQLDIPELVFKVASLKLRDSKISYSQSLTDRSMRKNSRKNKNNGKKLNIHLDNLTFSNNLLEYRNETTKERMQLDMGALKLLDGDLSLHDQLIQASKLALNESHFQYLKNGQAASSGPPDSTASSPDSTNWNFILGDLDLGGNSLSYQDDRYPHKKKNLDMKHVDIEAFNARIRKIKWDGDLEARVENLSFREGGQWRMNDLKGDFYYSSGEIRAEDFYLKTPGTELGNGTVVLQKFSNLKEMDADINLQGNVNTGDLTYFIPGLAAYLTEPLNLGIRTSLIKHNDKIAIDTLDLNTKEFQFQAHGSISGWENLKGMETDTLAIRAEGTKAGLARILPGKWIPDSLSIPEKFGIRMNLKGKLEGLKADIFLNSSLGDCTVHLLPSSRSNRDSIHWKAGVDIRKIQVGKILQQPAVGRISATLNLSGSGTDFKNMIYQLSGTIQKLDYSGFTYQDLKVQAQYNDPELNFELTTDQPEIAFQLNGNAAFIKNFPSLSFHLNLEKVDFDAIHLGPHNIIAKGVVDADIDSIQAGRLNGDVEIRNVAILKDGKLYRVDSLLLISVDQEKKSDLKVTSDLLDLTVKANMPVMRIPSALTDIAKDYLDGKTEKNDSSTNQLTFNLDLHKNKILTQVLLPGLTELDIKNFEGELDESKELLRLNIDMPALRYRSWTVQGLNININSGSDRLTGDLNVNKIQHGSLSLSTLNLRAITRKERLRLKLEIPKKDSLFLQVVSEIYRDNDRFDLHLLADSLYLNGKKWQVEPDNRMVFSNPIEVEHFRLSEGDQQILITGKTGNGQDSVATIQIKNFDLGALGSIFNTKEPFVGGTLSSDLHLVSGSGYPSGQVKIDSLSYRSQILGDLNLNTEPHGSGLNLDLELKPGTGSMSVRGSVLSKTNNQMDLKVDFEEFSVKSLKPFSVLFASTLQGKLNGELTLDGKITKPSVKGDLNLQQIKAFPEYLNTWMYVKDETIHFQGNRVKFNDFVIQDANDHEATLNGTLSMENFSKPDLDFSFSAQDFLAFNTEESADQIFYGKIIIDTDTRIQGSPQLLHINGNLTLREGSNVNVVIPGSGGKIIERDRIVNFIDRDQKENPFQLAVTEKARDTMRYSMKGIDLQANVKIDENSRVKLIIDQRYGDYLSLSGQGNFSLRLRPNGETSLTGRYDIGKGEYFLNFHQLVKRKFEILANSYIQWSGNPVGAKLNVQAQYQLKTQAPVTDAAGLLPFDINIKIRGDLLSPELSYSLSMPENARNQNGQVAAYLNDINQNESDLNKQVMSLILFQSFMSGQTMAGGSDLGFSNTARTSLSRFLTQQLNRLSTGIEGLNFNLNLASYETKVQDQKQAVTKLKLGLSQSLFNDRLKISVAGDVYLENYQSQSNDFLDHLDNVSLQYELTDNGDLELIGFRENEFDGLSQGEITKTGIGIIYSHDYDHLKELFHKDKGQ